MDAVEAVARALADLEIDNGEGGKYRLFELLDFSGENQTRVVIRTIAQAALSAARPFIAAEWQPIETAPKDGSAVILYDDRFAHSPSSYLMASWHAPLKVWAARPNSKGRFTLWHDATHWQPLPAPPTAIKETIR